MDCIGRKQVPFPGNLERIRKKRARYTGKIQLLQKVRCLPNWRQLSKY